MRGQEARRVLTRAAACCGGVPALADRLKISERMLRYYMESDEAMPDNLFLRIVDVILEARSAPPAD